MGLFGPDSDPANQLLKINAAKGWREIELLEPGSTGSAGANNLYFG
jgi:hypothetical protein